MLKTRRQAPNGVTYAKSHIAKWGLNLITVLALRNGILKQSIKNLLISTGEAICLRDACYAPEESDSATTNLLFCQDNVLVPAPVCLQESFILHSSSELLAICWTGCCSINELLSKANKIFQAYPVKKNFFKHFSRPQLNKYPCQLYIFSPCFPVLKPLVILILKSGMSYNALLPSSNGQTLSIL